MKSLKCCKCCYCCSCDKPIFGTFTTIGVDIKVRGIPLTPAHISDVRKLTLLIARSNIHRRLRTGKGAKTNALITMVQQVGR